MESGYQPSGVAEIGPKDVKLIYKLTPASTLQEAWAREETIFDMVGVSFLSVSLEECFEIRERAA